MVKKRTAPATFGPLLHALLASVLVHAAALTFLPGLRSQLPFELEPLSVDFRFLPQPEKVEPPRPEPVVREPPRKQEPPPPTARERVVRTPEPSPLPAPAAEPVAEPREASPGPQPVAPDVPPLLTAPAKAASSTPAFSVPAPEPSRPAVPAATRDSVPVAQPPSPAEPSRESLVQGYGHRLSRALEPHRRYPRIAQLRGWQGTVEMNVQLLPGGRLGEVKVTRSSGHDVLDEQALAMVRGATLPSVPASLNAREFSIRVPVEFRLRD